MIARYPQKRSLSSWCAAFAYRFSAPGMMVGASRSTDDVTWRQRAARSWAPVAPYGETNTLVPCLLSKDRSPQIPKTVGRSGFHNARREGENGEITRPLVGPDTVNVSKTFLSLAVTNGMPRSNRSLNRIQLRIDGLNGSGGDVSWHMYN